MQTKKLLPKTLLFFYLIPYLAVLLFTTLDCILNIYFFEWTWVTEWMSLVPGTLSYYLLLAMTYSFFGIMAYAVFFGKMRQKLTLCIVSLLASFLFPVLRYLIRHLTYGKIVTNVDMLDMYNEDVTIGVSLLAYAVLVLIVILLERAYYALFLREKPKNDRKPWSPKHPVGLSMLIFFSSVLLLTIVNFILTGEFSVDYILGFLLECFLNVAGFFLAGLSAFVLSKWAKVPENTEKID